MNSARYFGLVLFLFFAACGADTGPWNPVLEDTGFQYLDEAAVRVLERLDMVEGLLEQGQVGQAREVLAESRTVMATMKDYYVPLTELRQIVYDADRLYYMKKYEQAREKLTAARNIVLGMGSHSESEGFDRKLEELTLRVDKALFSLDDRTEDTYEHMKKLGNQINLMLVKGDLVTPTAKFE